ncbi:MAG: hypothetical protein QG577_1637 [Thermodesulfobacteriota bacterium]|nr:hypothetical protein [Thermodesulfobacteriota bacterium]
MIEVTTQKRDEFPEATAMACTRVSDFIFCLLHGALVENSH